MPLIRQREERSPDEKETIPGNEDSDQCTRRPPDRNEVPTPSSRGLLADRGQLFQAPAADDPILMLDHALPAKGATAIRTIRDGFARLVIPAAGLRESIPHGSG